MNIGNRQINGDTAIFTIDEVKPNTVATFNMDANIGIWSSDGMLLNTATLDNIPDSENGGFKTLTSNSTATDISAIPVISIPDTIVVTSTKDTIFLEAGLSNNANITWNTLGDGTFSNINNISTKYYLGAQDLINQKVTLFITVKTDCSEINKYVEVIIRECLLSIENITIGDCNDNGTPSDPSDDTFEVTFNISALNSGTDSTYTLKANDKTLGKFSYNSEQKITFPANDSIYTLIFEDTNLSGCTIRSEVNQASCSGECVLSLENITIGDCNDNDTPSDSSDDIFEVNFNVTAQNSGNNNSYTVKANNKSLGEFNYNSEQKITLPADGNTYTITFEDSDIFACSNHSDVSKNNCSNEKEESDIYIPNIFSPNNDSYNDNWYVTITGSDINILRCRIFDRWGELIYISNNDNHFSWDGKSKGQRVNTGVYTYIIEYQNTGENKTIVKAGTITLL